MKKNKLQLLQNILLVFIFSVWILKSVNVFPYLAGSVIKEPIFFGCAAALLRWNGTLKNVSTGLAILFMTIIMVLGMIPYKIHNYDLIFNVCGLLSSLLILHIVYNTDGLISGLLSNKWMVFIGKISYSLYLWHLPVFRIFAYHSTLPPLVSFFGKILVSFLMAIVSWYTIEKITTAYGRKWSKSITDKLTQQTS